MRPNVMLCATVGENNNIVAITALSDYVITFLGSSIPVSVALGDRCTSFTVKPKKGKGGIIAVTVTKPGYAAGFLLPLGWVNDRPHVDLENTYVSETGRLVQVNTVGELYAMIDGVQYTTSNKEGLKPGKAFVPDANLLCKYLAGNVSGKAVKATATEHAEEMSARERVLKLEQELQDVQGQITSQERVPEHYREDECERAERAAKNPS